MTKIACYFNGDRAYLKDLIKYDLSFIIKDENLVNEALKYQKRIVKEKYDTEYYDVVISESNDIGVSASKRIVIGDYKDKQPRTKYISKFDIKEIFANNKRDELKFSIVVPNYNNADWINRTIESVLKQDYNNWEMFIIDDMSSDNSVEVISKYKDDRITLIQNKIKLYNGGSRNVGILKAKETNPQGYLVFIDSDDWLASNDVLKSLNNFIEGEDLITMDYKYYQNGTIFGSGKCNRWKDKYDLFETNGCCCATWCKCIKVSIAPLFEFNTLMEDRNYHYRVVNKAKTISNLGKVTHIWNKDNTKSVTSNKKQKYESDLQTKIEWDNCAYRHIAGMLDLLNELEDKRMIAFIQKKINDCKGQVMSGVYLQW